MKKTVKKIISVLLCLCILSGMTSIVLAAESEPQELYYSSIEEYLEDCAQTEAVADTADTSGDTATADMSQLTSFITSLKKFFAKLLNFLSDFLINDIVARCLTLIVPDADSVQDYQSFDLEEYGNFYAGNTEFIDEPQGDKVWSLGYAQHSIMPSDFGEKEYAKGAYLPYVFGSEMYTDPDGNTEELRVRVIIMNDGSGRGNVVFASVDAMGLCNDDVRKIRAALADFAEQHNIISINVTCTHIHTGIDSQGVWTDPAGVLWNNITSDEVEYGVDRTFLQAVIDGTAEAVKAAYADMKQGTLWYSSTDIDEYLHDRTAPIAYDNMLYKLEFIPLNTAATPTCIVTFGCHPESASYDWDMQDENGKTVYDRKFTPDFVWSMEMVMNAAGYNFIYIQGDVSTTTSSRGLTNDGVDTDAHDTAMRYGFEMAYIALSISMTEEERIELNERTGDKLGIAKYKDVSDDYTIWYEGLPTVEAVEVEPVLNIASKQFFCNISNKAMAAIGKSSISDNLVLKDGWGNYYTVCEVGYMEIGDALKVYMSPGETFGELLLGGDGLDGFPYKSLRETLGDNVIVMDLMNEAAGYVANDANFVMVGLQYNEANDDFDDDTWCIISFGKHAGSTFIGQFYELVESVRPGTVA